MLEAETCNIINRDNSMSSHETELFVPSDSNHAVFKNILNYNDILLWPQNFKHLEIDHIIVTSLNGNEKRCNQQNIYPKYENNRNFSNSLFYFQINNGEQFVKNWLHYSDSKNPVFCLFL